MNPISRSLAFLSLVPFLPTLAQAQLPEDSHWFYDYGGPGSSEPYDFAIKGRYLYTGGAFLNVNGDSGAKNFARFDLQTEEWSRIPGLSPILNGVVREVYAADDGWIYFGGNFTDAGGVPSSRIARFHPASEVIEGLVDTNYTLASTGQEEGPTNGDVRAILKVGNFLYVGGRYTGPAGSPGNEKHIRRYDLVARTWEKVGDGLAQEDNEALSGVFDLVELPDGSILAGGEFEAGLARWDGTSWSPYGGGVGTPEQGVVRAIALGNDGKVYIGGDFLQVGSGANQIAASFVASYDPATDTWDDMNGGFDDEYIQSNGTSFTAQGVYDLEFSAGKLYAGGDFQANPDRSETNLDHVALWDGSGAWKPLGSGVGNTGSQIVNCVAIGPNQDLYVGGLFAEGWRNASSGNTTVARWDERRDFTDYVPGAAEVPVSIIGLTETEVTLEFRTRSFTDYRIRSSDTPETIGDVVSGPIAFRGDGEVMTRTVPRDGARGFFRLEAVPAF